MTRREELLQRIAKCEEHKRAIRENVTEIKKAPDLSATERDARIKSYLGNKSYDEWMLLYDELIAEARAELETLDEGLKETIFEGKRLVMTAAGVSLLFIMVLALFFLPKPVAVLTGNIIGAFGTGGLGIESGMPAVRALPEIDSLLAEAMAKARDSGSPVRIVNGEIIAGEEEAIAGAGAAESFLTPPANLGKRALTGRKDKSPVQEVLVTPATAYASYDAPMEVVKEESGVKGRRLTLRVKNTKQLPHVYLAVSPGTRVTIDGREPLFLGTTTDLLRDWDGDSFLGRIREELAGAGAETDLERSLPKPILPLPGEALSVYAYEQAPGSWADLTIDAPPGEGRVLFLDPAGAWWNDSWRYRRPVIITEQSGTSMENYSVRILLNSSNFDFSRAQSNGEDLRITWNTTNSSGDPVEVELPLWKEFWNSTTATVWTKLNLTANTNETLLLYYGNPAAVDVDDPDAVFETFINFTRDGIASYGGGQDADSTQYEILNDTSLRMWGNNWKRTLRTVVVPGDNSKVLEYWFTSDGQEGEINGAGFDTDDSLSSSWTYKIYGTQSWGITGDDTYTGPNGWELITETLDEYSGTFNRIFFVNDADSGQATNVTFRNVRVRTYAVSEPAATVLSEEKAELLNATLLTPPNSTRAYRGESFLMNGTVSCLRGACGNTSAWSQFYSSLSPTTTLTETTSSDFLSANTSANTSVSSGSLTISATLNDWFDTSWKYRFPINISNPNSVLLNYSINLSIDTASLIAAGKLKDDCSDLRFANTSGSPVPHWVESGCNTSSTTVWVKPPILAGGTNTTLYVYYGNPSAPSAGNPQDVFSIFLNFTQTGVASYGGQDLTPSQYKIVNDTALHMWGNVWKYAPLSQNFVVAGDGSQVLEYWYDNYGPQGEIHGSGFDNDNSLSSSWTYKIYGTQSWGITGDDTYTGPNGWELITETLDEYSGTFDRLFFVGDDDANSALNASFKNVRVRPFVANEPSQSGSGAESSLSFQPAALYISDSFDTGSDSNTFKKIWWGAQTPSNTTLSVSTRSSSDNATWSPWFLEVNDTLIDAPSARYVQYKVELSTTNTSKTPILDEINLQYQYTTAGFDEMSSTTGLALSATSTNPYDCVLSNGESCNVSWSVLPTQLGQFRIRIFTNLTNETSEPKTVAFSNNHTIEVYARTYLLSTSADPSTQARGENVTFTTTLLDDQSEPVAGALITITDGTDNLVLGNATTAGDGTASLNVMLAENATLGDHTVRFSYGGNSTSYFEQSNATTTIRVSSTPNITAPEAAPTIIGFGESVTISANVTDAVGVDTVWATITYPDQRVVNLTLANTGGDRYERLFNDTWKAGTYIFKLWANNTDGILSDPSGNFTVSVRGSMYADAEKDEYKNYETVHLADRRREDWWNSSWLYRSLVTVTGVNEPLSEYQVPLTIDTSSLISAGKLNADCSDLRFVAESSIYSFPVTVTNDLGSPLNATFKIEITDSSVLSHLSADGSDLRVFSSPVADPYAQQSNVPFWFMEKTESGATVWARLSLGGGENKTIYLYYGKSGVSSESNYSKVFTTPIGIAGTTAATGSFSATSFPFAFNETPVVVGSLTSVNDAAEAALRLANVTTSNFSAKAEESVTLDGVHASEDVDYLALKPGRWILGGREVDAGTALFDNPTGTTYTTVSFSTSFSSTPAVFAQVETYNESDPVHDRLDNPTASSVDMKLEETASSDTAHATERTGYLALTEGLYETGSGLLDVGTLTTTHTAATIPYTSLLSDPVVVSKIETENGGDNSHERVSAGASSATTRVEEEDAYDGAHTTETMSWLAATPGTLYGAPAGQEPSVTIGSESAVGSNTKQVDFYLEECNSTNSSVWVRVPFIPADENVTLYVYYGNPSASSASNLTETMTYDTPQIVGYVVNSNVGTLDVYSLVDGNSVSIGSTSASLDAHDSLSASVTPGTAIKATRQFQADSSSDATDAITPVSWAGTEFLYAFHRDTDRFDIVSPWGVANVTIYDGASQVWNGQVTSTGTTASIDVTNGNVARIVSDIPVLVQHWTTSNGDAAPLYPASGASLYGIPSTWITVAAGPSGAVVAVNSSGTVQTSWSLSPNTSYESSGYGSDFNEQAYRLDPNGSLIGALQEADSDGREITVFLPELQLGTLFGSVRGADTIAVAAPTLGTNCTVYDSSGSVVGSGTSGGNSLVSRVLFGAGNDNVYVSGGWIMECDAPVWAVYDEASKNDETHLLGIRDLRQYHYPEPSASVQNNSEEQAYTGLHNKGATNMTGYLYLRVESNASGSWSIVGAPVYQDITPRTLSPGEILNISYWWEYGGAWQTGTHQPGTYRVYAAFLDNESQVLVDSDGNALEDVGLFTIVEAILQLNNLTHENQYVVGLDEYEAGDTLDWVNVTIRAVNNTAINAEINLTLLNSSGAYPGWGPRSVQSCGNIPEGGTCTREWSNSSAGYPIPLTVPSSAYLFSWLVNMTSDNGPAVENNSFAITVHNTPSTFSSGLSPTRIFTGGSPASYNFTFTNLWSVNLTNITVRLNLPGGKGLNASCVGGGSPSAPGLCSLPQLANGTTTTFYFNISANSSAVQGDYYVNVTLNYSNPREDRSWSDVEPQLLEVRQEGIIAITVTNSPVNVTRGSSFEHSINAYVNNTASTTSYNVTANYTLPSSWTNTSPRDAFFSSLAPNETRWHNLSFTVGSSALPGPQQVLLESGSSGGQNDFKYIDITVWANTSLLDFWVNDTNASRGEYVRFNVTLRYDDGSPVSSATVTFRDETDNVTIGSAVTGSTGRATRTYLIPAGASVGLHTINVSYGGSSTLYTLSSWNTTVLDVGQKPVINALWASPDPQGAGSNVTLFTNVTDDDAVDTVLVSVSAPNGSLLLDRAVMAQSGGLYTRLFNETWRNGSYTFTVWANDTTGSAAGSSSTFTIENEAFLFLNVSQALYGQNANVTIDGNSAGWWFHPDWRYRRNITFSNLVDENFTDAQVNFTLDTASLISAGKLQSDCSDLRFLTEAGESLSPFITHCNDAATAVWLSLPSLPALGNATVYVYYGNPSASSVNTSLNESFWHGRQYVVSDTLATSALVVAGMYDNTTFCVDGSCQQINQGDIVTVSASSIASTTVLNASLPISTAFSYAGAGSHTVPLVFGLSNVTFPAPRGTQSIDVVAPFSDASVTLYDENDNAYSTLTVPRGGHGEINYNAPDGSALRLSANTTVVVHYEDETGNNDFMPLPPPAAELYGVPQANSVSYVACADDSTNVTIYESDGTVTYSVCNRTTPVLLPVGSGSGQGPGMHIVSNGSVVAFSVADGDGTEAVPFLAPELIDNYYVLPQDAEYITIVPVQPSTTCELRGPTGSLISSDTSTSYTSPRPQAVIRWTGTPITAGSRIECDADVWAYFESYSQNAETILLGDKSWRNTGPYTTSESVEVTHGSLLSNPGSTTLRGSLRLLIQRNISGGWQDYTTVLDDTLNGTIRVVNATSWLDVASLWNASPWNTGNAPAGAYRAYGELVAPDGEIIASTLAPGGLWNASLFNISQAQLRLNLTSITIYDVSDTLNTHTYTGNLTANATNTTFTLISGHAYRVEFHIENLADSALWNLSPDVVEHDGLNASWLVDAANDVWYRNASDTADRLGGSWNGTLLWNTSANKGLAANGTSVVFSYVLNLSGAVAENLPVLFLIDDPLLQLTDHSRFRVVLPDQQPPRLFNNTYNLTERVILRGGNTTIFARWDEAIKNATVSYNSTTSLLNTYDVSLPSPNPQNWTNYTIVTTPLWVLGSHSAKLAASDEQENWNDTLQLLNFTVWGLVRVTDSSITKSRLNLSDETTIACRVLDVTADPDAPIANYIVTFRNGTGVLGTNLTNSSGWASWTYNDSTPGVENLSCSVAENATRFYQVDSQNNASYQLTTLEPVAPYADNVGANVTLAHKGDAVLFSALWHDNFQLDTALLSVNASSSWSNVSNLSLSGSESWANFSYTIPNDFAPGTLGWRQYGNDTSGNRNETPVQSLEVWGWAVVESIALEPAFIYTTNTTLITCRVVDEQNGSGIAGYTVSFYNSTGLLGTNTTNSSGHASLSYTDYTSGIETIRCQISDAPTLLYNASSPDNKSASLTTGSGGDITPPWIVNGTYGLNATEVQKGGSLLLFAQWNEALNRSDALYNSTSSTIERFALPSPFTNNWTNYTITTNSSWLVGTHVAKLEATDLSNNTNTSASYLSFNVTATSRVGWVSPTTSQQPGSTTLVCRVTEEENGQPVEGYTVYFYNETGGLIATTVTNSTGHASTTYDTSAYDGSYDFTCRIFSDPSLFYYIGSDYQDGATLLFDGGAPGVVLNEPADNSVLTQSTLILNFTAVDDHDSLLDCNVTADNAVIASTTAPNNTKTGVTHSFSFGLHYWNVTCWDDLGNTNTSETRVFNVTSLDTTPPNVTLLAPADGAFINSTSASFSYNATDDTSVENCSFFLDGALNQTDTGVSSPDSFTASGLSEGLHSWAVSCIDPSGNERLSATRTFTIDVTPPSAPTLLSPPNSTITGNTTPLFSWQEVVESNFWNYTLEVSLSSSFASALTTRYTTFTKNDTEIASLPLQLDKMYYWRVLASDKAGWVTSSQVFTYITDASPPIVLLIAPPDGDNDPDGNVTLTFQANDNAISNCTLYTNISGPWLPNQTLTNVTPWSHASFNLSGLPTGQNFTFIWNVQCVDSLNYSAFAPANRSVRIGLFNETQGNQTIPVNASVNNTVPRTLSVSAPSTVDLIANGFQTVTCSANISDDNGAADVLGATGRIYRGTVSAGSPDNASNHYTNGSCGSCAVVNETVVLCSCNFSLAYYALPGTWSCDVRGVDLGGNGTSSVVASLTVNELQAVDVRPTLLNYGNVQGGAPSPEQNVSIINLGNVPLDVKLWGYALTPGDNLSMSCLNGANISVSSERFSTTPGTPFVSMTSLSSDLSSAPLADMNVPVRSGGENSTLPLYWRIESGSGVLGECNGTIVFNAEIG